MTNYNWVDNPTESGVAICDPDILNECLMHLKYDNQQISKIYGCFNSGNVNSNGNADLIETQESTKEIFNVPGNYNVRIPVSGYYQVVLVGGGGKGQGPSLNYMGLYSYCGGGSGAAFAGEIYLESGYHSVKVGGAGGNSSIGTLIVAGGSTNAGMSNYNMQRSGGYGGVLTVSSSAQIQNVTVQRNGNNGGFNNTGSGQAGGASVYQGYGKGADSSNQGRTNGYFSIVIPSYTNNIVYKVGGSYKPLAGTLADGTQFTLNGINSDDISNLSDGNYVKYIGSDGSSELLNTSLTVSKVQPAAASGKVWINNAVSPLSAKKYVEPNYTKVGNPGPTISVDGIASGFSSGYIKTNTPIPVNKDFVLRFEYTVTEDFLTKYNSNQQYVIGGTYNSENDVVPILFEHTNSTNKLVRFILTLNNSGSNQTEPLNSSQFNIVLGDVIRAELSRENGNYTAKYYKNGIQIGNDVVGSSTNNLIFESDLIIGQYKSNWANQVFLGSIDLNAFKIYVNDELVYQPNVLNNGWVNYDKIPLGKITVSSGAVSAVESFPYNIDYIGNNIVKSYKNGNVGYQIYADGYCVQWGRAEGASGGTVNLPVEYADSSYNIQLTSHRTNSNYDTTAYVTGRSKGSFNWSSTASYTAGMNWVTFGYIN